MLIFWGTKVRRRGKGGASHFCPVCRTVCTFRVVEVMAVSHLYWIPLGRGKRIAEELACGGCGVLLGFEPGSVRQRSAEDESLRDLGPTPVSLDALAERVELETRAQRGQLTRDERLALLAEPFVALGYMHEVKCSRGLQTSISAVLQLLLVVGIVANLFLWFNYSGAHPPSASLLAWCIGAATATTLLAAIVIYRGFTDRQRAASSYVHRFLVASLRPLAPTAGELDAVLAELREHRLELATIVDAGSLAAAITLPDRSSPPAANHPTPAA